MHDDGDRCIMYSVGDVTLPSPNGFNKLVEGLAEVSGLLRSKAFNELVREVWWAMKFRRKSGKKEGDRFLTPSRYNVPE